MSHMNTIFISEDPTQVMSSSVLGFGMEALSSKRSRTDMGVPTFSRGDICFPGLVASIVLPMVAVTQITHAVSRITLSSHKEVKYKGKHW